WVLPFQLRVGPRCHRSILKSVTTRVIPGPRGPKYLFWEVVPSCGISFQINMNYLTTVISQAPFLFSSSIVIGLSGDFIVFPFFGLNSCEDCPITVAFEPLVSTRRSVTFMLIDWALSK